MKLQLKIAPVLVAAAATVGLAASAHGAVTFEFGTGAGFVGKGDVQTAFAWNNAQLQRNAAGVSFEATSTTSYDVTCEWQTETGGPNSKVIDHAVTVHRNTHVNGSITYDPRVRTQITGFTLRGYGQTTTTGGTVPVIGDSCPMAHESAVVTAVASETSGTELAARYGAARVVLLTS
jgi:hypothetical protein